MDSTDHCRHWARPLIGFTILLGLLSGAPQHWVDTAHAKTDSAIRYRMERLGSQRLSIQQSRNPSVDVKVATAPAETQVTAEGEFVVETVEHNALLLGNAGDSATLSYANGQYQATIDDATVSSATPLQVTPRKLRKAVQVHNIDRRPAWNTAINDNQFWGSLRVVYSDYDHEAVIVVHTPIERYIRGLGEAGNTEHPQKIRAVLVAARTYILQKINTYATSPKYPGAPYMVTDGEGDQVFLGATFSRRSAKVVNAQRATKRQVMLYDGQPIIAAYHSQSNGTILTWSQAFGGSEKPYLSKQKDDPCCHGLSRLGHGTGMSGKGAAYFAEAGWQWQDIVGYYYENISISPGY